MTTALALFLAYLFGSIPFGLILSRLAGEGDIREIGSGNIGATNVLRTGNKGLAALTLLFDAGKAAVAGLLVGFAFGVPPLWGAAFALIGHCYPVWLKFRGGKGVATFFGALLVGPILLFGLAALSWIAIAAATRYSSLAALVTALVVLVVGWWLYPFPHVIGPLIVMVALMFWRHRENIGRLVRGRESRIGAK